MHSASKPSLPRLGVGLAILALLTTACGTRVSRDAIIAAEGGTAGAATAATAGGERAGGPIDSVLRDGTTTHTGEAAGEPGPGPEADGSGRSAAQGSADATSADSSGPRVDADGGDPGDSSSGGDPATTSTQQPTSTGGGGDAPLASGRKFECSEQGSPIVIGQVGGWSGIVSNVLLPSRTAMQVWVESTNAAGGVACHPIQLFQEDDASDPSRSSAAVNKLVRERGAVAIVGASVPISIVGFRSAVEELGVPAVGGDSLNPDWSQSPMLFPMGTTFDATIIGAVKELGDQGATKGGVIYCVEAKNCTDANATLTERGGFDVAGVENVFSAQISLTQTDFSGQCQQAKNAGAQQLLLAMDGSAISRVMQSCASLDYYPKIATSPIAVGSSVTQDENVRQATMSLAHTVFPWTLAETPPQQRYQDALATYAPNLKSDGATSATWVAGELFKAAVESLGERALGDVTTEMVLEGLGNIENETLGGLTVPLNFEAGQSSAPQQNCYFPVLLEQEGFRATNGSEARCL